MRLAAVFATTIAGIVINGLAVVGVESITRTISSYILQVKFKTTVTATSTHGISHDPASIIPDGLKSSIIRMERLFPFSDEVLDRLRSVAPNQLPDLRQWMVVTVSNSAISSVNRVADELRNLSGVDVVNVIMNRAKPPPPPISPKDMQIERNNTRTNRNSRRTQATPDYRNLQFHMNPAPEGIDVHYMWTIEGGGGENVRVYDIEYGWNQDHEDLLKAENVQVLVEDGYFYKSVWPDHGTAVLGELFGDKNNGFGVEGIVPFADVGLAANWVVDQSGNLYDKTATAIVLSLINGKAGDVILLEAQNWVCNNPLGTCGANQLGCGPVEWDDAVYDAILYAVANNVAVVEAAGNGESDLDDAGCNGKFDSTIRDSGAIIVGAGSSPYAVVPRAPLDFTSYGSRIDLQGYGESVTTAGYGDLQNVEYNRLYTSTFGGTSSASPIVAGAVASIQSAAISYIGKPLPPKMIRTLLRRLGTAQGGDLIKQIGPLPNLRSVAQYLNFKCLKNYKMRCRTWAGVNGIWMQTTGASGTLRCRRACIAKSSIHTFYTKWWRCGRCPLS